VTADYPLWINHMILIAGPKGLCRSDRKWMIQLAGNSGFRMVSRVYVLSREDFAKQLHNPYHG
jgi:hypothetical protein